jgi:S-adenosylmethionine hydrolase
MSEPKQNNSSPIITLTTDFGEQDGYVGTMRGVILSICPSVILTNLSHSIPPQDIRTAAFVLVGSKRRAIAVRTNQGIFVGPDNGVFSLVMSANDTHVIEAVTLINPDYRLPNVSTTFHGRDIFAPAAAHIANGVPLNKLGPAAINLVRLDFKLKPQDDVCRVMHIDRFGNLILNITSDDIDDPKHVTFTIGHKTINSLSQTFVDVEEGQLLAYIGSLRNHIEIAVRNGNAVRALGIQVGDVVEVTGSRIGI